MNGLASKAKRVSERHSKSFRFGKGDVIGGRLDCGAYCNGGLCCIRRYLAAVVVMTV